MANYVVCFGVMFLLVVVYPFWGSLNFLNLQACAFCQIWEFCSDFFEYFPNLSLSLPLSVSLSVCLSVCHYYHDSGPWDSGDSVKLCQTCDPDKQWGVKNFCHPFCVWKQLIAKNHPYPHDLDKSHPMFWFAYDQTRYKSSKFSFFVSEMVSWTACSHWWVRTKCMLTNTGLRLHQILVSHPPQLSQQTKLLQAGRPQGKTFSDLPPIMASPVHLTHCPWLTAAHSAYLVRVET